MGKHRRKKLPVAPAGSRASSHSEASKQNAPSNASLWGVGIITAFAAVAEKVGWPGTALLFLFGAVERWATDDQKQQIIQLYVIGDGFGTAGPFWAMTSTGGLLIVATVVSFKKREKDDKAEIRRLSAEKRALQQRLDDCHNRTTR